MGRPRHNEDHPPAVLLCSLLLSPARDNGRQTLYEYSVSLTGLTSSTFTHTILIDLKILHSSSEQRHRKGRFEMEKKNYQFTTNRDDSPRLVLSSFHVCTRIRTQTVPPKGIPRECARAGDRSERDQAIFLIAHRLQKPDGSES